MSFASTNRLEHVSNPTTRERLCLEKIVFGSHWGWTYAKQMRRKKPINNDFLVDIEPLTENQKKFFEEYDKNKHLLLMDVREPERRSLLYTKHCT